MDVRELLLNSELQHLGQMMHIVSYELTILTDFIREQFGSSYESFRTKHALCNKDSNISNLQSQPSTSSKVEDRQLRSGKLAKDILPRKQRRTRNLSGSTTSTPNQLSDLDVGANINPLGKLDVGDNVENEFQDDFDPLGYEDEHEESQDLIEKETDDSVNANNLPEDVDLPEGSVLIEPSELTSKRRKRKAIWGKFIIAKTPNNKLIAKCPTCLNLVSNKVERLENHYAKCTPANRGKRPIATTRVVMSSDDVPSGGTLTLDEKTGIATTRKPTGKWADRGRTADQIWNYFDVFENSEPEPGKTWKKKIVKCKRCEKEISPKVERLRKHFMICSGIYNETDDVSIVSTRSIVGEPMENSNEQN